MDQDKTPYRNTGVSLAPDPAAPEEAPFIDNAGEQSGNMDSAGSLLLGLTHYYAEDTDPDEIQTDPHTLVEQVDAHIASVLGYIPGIREDKAKTACAQVALLLYDKSYNESKNELLVCKLFAVLFRGEYRSHYDDTYAYMRGSWNRVTALPYSALEFATNSIRAAEGVFRILHSEYPHPRRSISAIAERMRDILENQSVSSILSADPSPPAAPCIWLQEVVKLCAAMFKNFVDPGRDRVVLSNFLKWASEPMPARQAGVNFNNRYYEICHENRPPGKLVCTRKSKSPHRNCYTSVPHDISYRLPDSAVRRMRTFLTTTFSGTGGALEMFLAYMSLVAAGVRLPEIILIFVGPGGEGKTLLLCDLMRAVWGSGHAVAPPSILQTAEEFRKQGHLYRGMRWVSVDKSKNNIGIKFF